MRCLTTGLYLFAAACSNGTVSTIDASAPDANQSADVQASDAEASDAAGADAGRADAGAIDSGAGCAAPTGGPTRHNGVTLNATESWRAADSPHVVLGDYVVGVGGRLILEPCTEIQIVSGSYFYVLGALSARGEPGRPITIRARDVGTRFASIVIRTATVADLAWVEIEDGGDLPNSTAGTTLLLQSPGWPPSPVAHVEHVVIRDSAGYGVDVQGHARFTPTSQDLTIVGARVDHVRIEHAGAHGGDSGWGCPPSGMFDSDGAIKIFNEPSSAFVTSSTLAHSSSHGIYRAWQGGNLSLLATNTFIDIAGCFEVEPKAPPPGPVCSPTPSCPR